MIELIELTWHARQDKFCHRVASYHETRTTVRLDEISIVEISKRATPLSRSRCNLLLEINWRRALREIVLFTFTVTRSIYLGYLGPWALLFPISARGPALPFRRLGVKRIKGFPVSREETGETEAVRRGLFDHCEMFAHQKVVDVDVPRKVYVSTTL